MTSRTISSHFMSFCIGSALTLAAVSVMGTGPFRFESNSFVSLPQAISWALVDFKFAAFAFAAAVCSLAIVMFGGDLRSAAHAVVLQTKQALSARRLAQDIRPSGLADVVGARDELERQLGRFIMLITGHLESSKEQTATLRRANTELASITEIAQIRQIIDRLVDSNQKTQRETIELEVRLEEAQAQAKALRQRLTQAEKLASVDSLTQVANRRRFEQFVGSEVDRCHEDGTPLCLIMTDIDHFKSVNDTYGHAVGDEVLKAFAGLLTRSVRSSDLVARYGGEEFAIVLPRTPMGNAYDIAERMRARFQSTDWTEHVQSTGMSSLTASFGVAEIRDGEPPSALMQRADQMLYDSKRKGRNRTSIWGSAVDS